MAFHLKMRNSLARPVDHVLFSFTARQSPFADVQNLQDLENLDGMYCNFVIYIADTRMTLKLLCTLCSDSLRHFTRSEGPGIKCL